MAPTKTCQDRALGTKQAKHADLSSWLICLSLGSSGARGRRLHTLHQWLCRVRHSSKAGPDRCADSSSCHVLC